MKNFVSILLLFLCCTNVFGQQKADSTCAQYHTGKFVYTDSTGTLIRIKRTKNFQTEYNDSKEVWVNCRIKWISDCEYQLKQVGTNSKSKRKNNHGVNRVVISKRKGPNEYEYECFCSCKDSEIPKEKGTMVRMIN